MTRRIYTSIEFDHETLSRFVDPDDESQASEFLDYLAGETEPSYRAQARELESFLWQRQSHVLGRADRL